MSSNDSKEHVAVFVTPLIERLRRASPFGSLAEIEGYAEHVDPTRVRVWKDLRLDECVEVATDAVLESTVISEADGKVRVWLLDSTQVRVIRVESHQISASDLGAWREPALTATHRKKIESTRAARCNVFQGRLDQAYGDYFDALDSGDYERANEIMANTIRPTLAEMRLLKCTEWGYSSF